MLQFGKTLSVTGVQSWLAPSLNRGTLGEGPHTKQCGSFFLECRLAAFPFHDQVAMQCHQVSKLILTGKQIHDFLSRSEKLHEPNLAFWLEMTCHDFEVVEEGNSIHFLKHQVPLEDVEVLGMK